MIKKKNVREIAEKYKKKVSKKVLVKIDDIIKEKIEEIINKASRKANFSGRKIILEEERL